MQVFLFLIVFLPLVMMAVGLYRVLKWAKLVKTWNKTIGSVVGYYHKANDGTPAQRVTELVHLYHRDHNRLSRRDYYSAIIKYEYGLQFYEVVHWTNSPEALPYQLGENVMIFVHPKDPLQTRVGDNITQLWLPFLIFAIGLALSVAILVWGMEHDWKVY
jgi:hypothetical protein